MSGFSITLSPNSSFDQRPKRFTLGETQWRRAVHLVDREGFRPNLVGALDKRDVPLFAQYLRQALANQRVPDEDRPILHKLADYLTGPGSNVRGLCITRGWKN